MFHVKQYGKGGGIMGNMKKKVPWQVKSTALLCGLICITIWFVQSGKANADIFLSATQKINTALSRLFSCVDFSVGECIVILMSVILLVFASKSIISAVLEKSFRPLTGYILNTAHIFSVIACIFVLVWGGNYASQNTAQEKFNVELSADGYNYEDLLSAAEILGNKADAYAIAVKRDAGGILADFEFKTVKGKIQNVFSEFAEKYPQFKQDYYAEPKQIFNTELLSYLGIRGIYSPFTAESNVNTNIPPVSVPFVICHETAHRLGIVKEDEANFAAFLAGINSEDPVYAYSSYFTALVAVAEKMYELRPEKTQAWLSGRSEAVKTDIYRYSHSGKKYNTKLKKIGTLANSAYIQAMGDGRGADSYDGMTDLICAYCIGMV